MRDALLGDRFESLPDDAQNINKIQTSILEEQRGLREEMKGIREEHATFERT